MLGPMCILPNLIEPNKIIAGFFTYEHRQIDLFLRFRFDSPMPIKCSALITFGELSARLYRALAKYHLGQLTFNGERLLH